MVAQMSKKLPEEAPTECCCVGLESLLDPRLFKALSDPSRVTLLVGLAQGCRPQTVSRTAGCCSVDLSVVSRHLAQLREVGIVRAEKRGKEVYYEVDYSRLVQSLRSIADALEACCGSGGRKEKEEP
jgi:DNA-binding transcriptional ArsR family regulator